MPVRVQKPKRPSCAKTAPFLAAIAILIAIDGTHCIRAGETWFTISKETTFVTRPLDQRRIRRLCRRFERSRQRRGDRREQRGRVARAGHGFLGVERTRSDSFLQHARHGDSRKAAGRRWAVPQDHQRGEREAGLELVRDKPWSARRFPSFAKWLAERQTVLDLAVEASQRPRCYLPLIRPATSEMANDLPLAPVRAASTIAEALVRGPRSA